jgi:hypothetical protein
MLARLYNLCGERRWGLCPSFQTALKAESATQAGAVTKSVTELTASTPQPISTAVPGKDGKRSGAKPVGERALTPAEKQAAYRERKKGKTDRECLVTCVFCFASPQLALQSRS